MALADPPDACSRVVAHFDVDCFYAQAEVLRRPCLRDRPVGITQKFLVVTTNYVARGLGVPKMVSIDEARKKCPELVLINGEDLTPYRAASKHIMAVLRRFGTLEKLGLDEGAVDITAEVKARAASGMKAQIFSGHVIGSSSQLSRSLEGISSSDCAGSEDLKCLDQMGFAGVQGDNLLMLGSQIVSEIRAAVERETGFQMSCGLAHNLPGVGHCMEGVLKQSGVESVGDLRNLTLDHLCRMFGERVAKFMYQACKGYDNTPVHDKGPCKSISVEDSFWNCTTLQQVEIIMWQLAPDLVSRLDEDKADTGRTPKRFTVKWRTKSIMNFSSVSCPMPADLLLSTLPIEKRRESVVETGMKLVSHSFNGRPFHMVVLNIGATAFSPTLNEVSSSAADIRQLLGVKSSNGSQTGLARISILDDGAECKIDSTKPYAELQPYCQKTPTRLLSKGQARICREGHHIFKSPVPWFSKMSQGTDFGGTLGSLSDPSDDSDSNEDGSDWIYRSTQDCKEIKVYGKEFLASSSGGPKDGTLECQVQSVGMKWHKFSSEPNKCCEGKLCSQCGEFVEGNEQEQQEHADYHLALKLDSEHKREIASSTLVAKAPSFGKKKLGSKDKPATSSPLSKRPKLQNGTLDSFIMRM
ncbi:hypothetical protein BDL97_08G068200 [Sphagnum fallax]|nr:hypothetical protein BDL97_08G068200 [Sphagnum fallax]